MIRSSDFGIFFVKKYVFWVRKLTFYGLESFISILSCQNPIWLLKLAKMRTYVGHFKGSVTIVQHDFRYFISIKLIRN